MRAESHLPGFDQSVEDKVEEERLDEIARLIRPVRAVAALLAVFRYLIYIPPNGKELPFSPVLAGILIAAVLLAANFISLAGSRRGRKALLRNSVAELVIDSAVVLAALALTSYEGRNPGYALLMIPIFEASARFGLRAAAATWLITGAGYAAISSIMADITNRPAEPGVLSYQLAAIFIVVVMTGLLGDLTARQLNRAKRQAIFADRRSDLLKIAAESSRAMATLQTGQVEDAILAGAMKLGFEAVDVYMAGESGKWQLNRHIGLPSSYVPDPTYVSDPNIAEVGVVGEVRTRGHTVVIDHYQDREPALKEIVEDGFNVVVGIPIWRSGEIIGVLSVGTTASRHILPAEVECLELLAAQAGAAFEAVRHLDETRGLEDRLAYEVSHDHLTGLPNRAWFLERLDESLNKGITSVLVCDIDRFKTINDSLGHQLGDVLLDLIAARLLSLVGSGGMVARIGADEFAIQLSGTTAETAMDMAGAILDGMTKPISLGHQELVISFSIGVASSEDSPTIEATTLLRDADLAMYRAKRAGRSRCELFDLDLRARARRRMETETELRKALTQGGLTVAYQPVVSLATGTIVSVEALARWHHPVHGPIHPDEFIPMAEETGLIWDLGRSVLSQACHEARGWRHILGEGSPRIGVNLSAVQLQDSKCVAMVEEVLQSTGLDASSLVLEITEGVVMSDSAEVFETVTNLANLGLRLAVDDFGKGWSSLAYLARYPFSELKIDSSFVKAVATRTADRAIVASIVRLAHELGLVVVAEGIEDQSQLEELTQLGCDEGQGFFLHRPLAPLAMSSLVQRLSF